MLAAVLRQTGARVIRFYRAPWSTNCDRVAIALAHKGLAAESVWIDYSDRSVIERAFLRSETPAASSVPRTTL